MADEIQVYIMYSAPELYALKDGLRDIIFENKDTIDNVERVFTVSPSSGWMTFNDNSKIWKSTDGNNLPDTATDAFEIAENFIEGVNKKTAQFNEKNKTALKGIFPDKTQRNLSKCELVKHFDGSWTDHWLCCYEIAIYAGIPKGQKIFVYGMGMDIRIGKQKQVISFVTRCRPVKRPIYTKLYEMEDYAFLLNKDEHDGNNGADANNKDERPLIYLYDGNCGNQYYLAPYYYTGGSDELSITPATRYSLVAFIQQEDRPKGTMLTVYVYGGSGDYDFNWGYWNIATLWGNDGGVEELGQGDIELIRRDTGSFVTSSVNVGSGHYNMMVNVIDRKTGAYVYGSQIVFTQTIKQTDAIV